MTGPVCPPRTSAAPPLRLPKRCVNTDHFVIHLRRPRHQRIVRVKVYIDGTQVLGRRGRNLKKVVLHEVPEGRKFRLRIVEYTNKGIRISRSRTYRGCADKR